MPRQTRPKTATKKRVPDNNAIAGALFGPLHAYVCQFAQGATPYKIRFLSGLPKRTVDAAVSTLEEAGIITARRLRYYHATIPYAWVSQVFGKRAPALAVYSGIPQPRRRRRRRVLPRN